MEAVRLWESKDPDEINAVINHPKVRPWIASASEGVLNIQAQLERPFNLFLMGEFGGVMFTKIMGGILEVHTFVLPEGQGTGWALDMVMAAQRWAFTKTDAFEILTRIPHTHKAALSLAIRAGMKPEYFRQDGVLYDGQVIPVDVYKVTLSDWIANDKWVEKRGALFHQWLNEQAARAGFRNPHEDDPEHNRIVGATLEMFSNGWATKAVQVYNRWAWIARHAVIKLVSPTEVAFDIGKLRLANGELEYEPCPGVVN